MIDIKGCGAAPKFSNIFVCLYGDPGNRKTSFAITAESPLVLDFDRRAHRAYEPEKADRVDVTSFDDIVEAAQKYKNKYKTLVIDTVGRALDMKSEEIVRVSKAQPGLKAHNPFGGLSLPGYGILKSAFYTALQAVRNTGMDVVFVAHGSRVKENDQTSWAPDIVGSSADEIYKACDLLGLVAPMGGRTVLRLNPSELWQAKNPLGLGTIQIDKEGEPGWDVTLASLIEKCREKNIETVKEILKPEPPSIISKINKMETMKEANEILKEILATKDVSERDMATAAFKIRREGLGFKYNKEKGEIVQ